MYKFIQLLNVNNRQILINLAKFIKEAFTLRASSMNNIEASTIQGIVL